MTGRQLVFCYVMLLTSALNLYWNRRDPWKTTNCTLQFSEHHSFFKQKWLYLVSSLQRPNIVSKYSWISQIQIPSYGLEILFRSIESLNYREVDRRIYRGSYMSSHILLNLLNKLGKKDKMEACRTFYLFFPTSLINPIIQEHECSVLVIIWD